MNSEWQKSRGRWSSGARTKRILRTEGFLDSIQEGAFEVRSEQTFGTKKVCQSLEKTMSKSSSVPLGQ